MEEFRSPEKLELMITIVSRAKADYFMDFIQSFEVNMQTAILGEGTAGTQMLSLLGLSDSNKTVILSVIKKEMVNKALTEIEGKFATIKNTYGIAFTVSLSSVIGVSVFEFLANNRERTKLI